MDNCPSYILALSNILEHFLGLLHVSAEQCTSRRLLPLCWLPSLASNSESLVALLTEVFLTAGVEAATKVLAADANDSSI